MFTKLLALVIVASAFAASAHAALKAPHWRENQAIVEQAKALGYRGEWILACYDADRKLVLGGLSSWSTAPEIYLVEDDGAIVATQGDAQNKPGPKQRYTTADGAVVTLDFGTAGDTSGLLETYTDVTLTRGAAKGKSQTLTCFELTNGKTW